MLIKVVILILASSTVATPIRPFPPHLVGNVSAVYALIERYVCCVYCNSRARGIVSHVYY